MPPPMRTIWNPRISPRASFDSGTFQRPQSLYVPTDCFNSPACQALSFPPAQTLALQVPKEAAININQESEVHARECYDS